jgi:hypothetical protein
MSVIGGSGHRADIRHDFGVFIAIVFAWHWTVTLGAAFRWPTF